MSEALVRSTLYIREWLTYSKRHFELIEEEGGALFVTIRKPNATHIKQLPLSELISVDVVSEAAFEFVVHIAGEKLQLRAGEKIEFQGWVGALRALGGLDEYHFADPCPELQQPQQQRRSSSSSGDATAEEPESPEPAPAPSARARRTAGSADSELEREAGHVDDDVLNAAEALGMQLGRREDRRLLWIAQLCAADPVPREWSPQVDARGRTFWSNAATRESAWLPPSHAAHRAMYAEQLKRLRAGRCGLPEPELGRAVWTLAEQELELQGITNDVEEAKRELALELRRLLLTGFLRIDKRTVLYSV